jgi:hypothetical protein
MAIGSVLENKVYNLDSVSTQMRLMIAAYL